MDDLKEKIEALPVHEMDTMQGVIDVVDREAVLVLVATHAAEPAPVVVEPVAWQWRSRIKGGAWDAWENGRWHGEQPPFLDIEQRPLYAHPSTAPTGNTALVEALLAEVRDKGLIYWEPNTTRGHVQKADMLHRIDAALSQPAAPQPTPEVEALEAVDAYERSTWFGPEGEKNKRRAWKGVMRKVRAALAQHPTPQPENPHDHE